jgi:hypothetical protein
MMLSVWIFHHNVLIEGINYNQLMLMIAQNKHDHACTELSQPPRNVVFNALKDCNPLRVCFATSLEHGVEGLAASPPPQNMALA